MSKTVTLRLSDEIHSLFRAYAKSDNRSLSNSIETSTLRYIREHEFADDLPEVAANEDLHKSLKRARLDMKERKGRKVS
jgi:hypothetical protein